MPFSKKEPELDEEKAAAVDTPTGQAEKPVAQLAAPPAAVPAVVCPTCKHELVKHGAANPFKVGCWHCDGCGVCWAPDLKGPR